MNRVTLLSIAFLAFAIGLSVWLLNRPKAAVEDDAAGGGAFSDPRSSMTFAEWSVRSDGVLLADIDPGKSASTVPRRFMVVPVKVGANGDIVATDGQSFSWAEADRGASSGALFALGFRVQTDGLAFTAPDDPMWSDPIVRVDGGTEQTVTLRAKTSGATATFVRRRGDPKAAPYWNRRAIGFVSSDGHLVYITPDALVIHAAGH